MLVIRIVADILTMIRRGGIRTLKIAVVLFASVVCIEDMHKTTARLYGRDVSFGDGESFRYRELQFSIYRARTQLREPVVRLQIDSDSLPIDQFGELLALLFECGVVFYGQSLE